MSINLMAIGSTAVSICGQLLAGPFGVNMGQTILRETVESKKVNHVSSYVFAGATAFLLNSSVSIIKNPVLFGAFLINSACS
jgi:hypothetical protein